MGVLLKNLILKILHLIDRCITQNQTSFHAFILLDNSEIVNYLQMCPHKSVG